jgi:hypothetical protein
VPAAWTAGEQTRGTDGDGFTYAAWEGLTDPVVGCTADRVVFRARPSPPDKATLAAYGPQERINPALAFGLAAAVPELARADITRASKRYGPLPPPPPPPPPPPATPPTDDASAAAAAAAVSAPPLPPATSAAVVSDAPLPPLFYEWELAVPPEYCPSNTGCNSVAVYFVSVTINDGVLCVLTLTQSKEDQYRRNAGAVRAARATFGVIDGAVADAAAAVEAEAAAAAARRGAPAAPPGVIVASP